MAIIADLMYCVLSGLHTLSYDAAAAPRPARHLKLGQDIHAEMPYGPYN